MRSRFEEGKMSDFLDRFIKSEALLIKAQCHFKEAIRLEQECRPRCGNCDHWMKIPQCPRESFDRKNRPSRMGLACSKYLEMESISEFRRMADEERLKAKELTSKAHRTE
jgi:hypothetical protein